MTDALACPAPDCDGQMEVRPGWETPRALVCGKCGEYFYSTGPAGAMTAVREHGPTGEQLEAFLRAVWP